MAALVLSTMKSGNRSPGGVDNAGSVAIVLAAAERLIGELPDDIELIVLSTGAEEDHMIGAMRWLDTNAEYARFAGVLPQPRWRRRSRAGGAHRALRFRPALFG